MKYKLTEETKEFLGHKLHRIVCVTAFASVSVGDIGGWVESEKNLSQYGDAWVYGDAKVSGNAEVCEFTVAINFCPKCGRKLSEDK